MSGTDRRNILLLNSSHSRFPLGSDSWVTATLAALGRLEAARNRLVTSIGLPGWELTAWAAGRAGFLQRLVLPGEDNSAGRSYFHRCLDDFGLSEQRTEPVFTGGADSSRFRALRDRLVFELSGTAAPISLRPGGRLDKLLAEYETRGSTVDNNFRVDFETGGWKPRYKLDAAKLNPELEALNEGWLFHWTHSHPGPWPGEPPSAYYSELISNPNIFVRSAAATLGRIAREGLLRGSSFHKPGGEMMVSMTSLSPAGAIPLMRWRSRYRRWSIEPYGVAIRKTSLLSLGARRVRYFDSIAANLPERDRPFIQLRGKITDWRSEAEWRVHGDINLGAIDPADIVLLIYESHWRPPEPDLLSGCKIIPLFTEKN